MATAWFKHPFRFPKNADGPFYTTGHECPATADPAAAIVWCGDCLACGAPEAAAPALFALFDENHTDTYFVRQPATDEETEMAIMSARICCLSAVRYGGTDREIITKLGNDPEVCDYVVTEAGDLRVVVGMDGKLLPFAQQIVDARRAEYLRNKKKQNRKWWQIWKL